MTTTSNVPAERKSLAGQLDRLDTILDGLADGLNEAVATAVKQAVTSAVEAALVEVLTSAELQRRLRAEPEGKPGWFRRTAAALCRGVTGVAQGCWSRAAGLAGRCRRAAGQVASAVRQGGAVAVAHARRGTTAFGRLVWLGWLVAAGLVRRFRRPLLAVAAVGAALGVAGYLAGPAVLSLAGAAAVFVAALAAGATLRLRRLLRDVGWGEGGVGAAP
jgi:hypothetical protein